MMTSSLSVTVIVRFWGPVVCFKFNFTFIVDPNTKG